MIESRSPHMPADLRFAIRLLRRSPAFLLTSVLSLALGIGASTVMFSALRGAILKPLPYAEPDRLVEIAKLIPDGRTISVTVSDLDFLRTHATSFESFGSYGFYRPFTMMGMGEPTNVVARAVEADLFPALGARPYLGRVFAASDFQNGNPATAVLTWDLWSLRFNGDRAAVGRQIMLDNQSYTVIGVMPRDFHFPSSFTTLWIPDREPPANGRTARNVIARLKPGVTRKAALAELERLRPALMTNRPFRFAADVLGSTDVEKYRASFLMLCGAVGLLVLIACLNVANLIVARSVARETEFAVRGALGASRGRLIRQVLVESMVLAGAGGALGIALAFAGNKLLLASHHHIGRLGESRLDLTVLSFALALTTLTALLFGMGPALLLSRFSMREMSRTVTQSARRIRWRETLIAAEVALSLTLLIGAGLLIRSFAILAHVDPGFRTDHVLSLMIPASTQMTKDKPALVRRIAGILERSEQLPGVELAGIASAIPMGTVNVSLTFELPEHPHEEQGANYKAVSPNYFATMGMPLRLGRMLDDRDHEGAPDVAIVNEAFARKYWPGRNPIGQRLTGPRAITVVGVVADTHTWQLSKPAEPEFYCPYRQYLGPALGAMLVARTRIDPAGIAAALRNTIHEGYPDQPVADVATMEARVADSMAEPRFYTVLLGAFAGVALLLTAIGIYGVIAYSVGNRTREFAIRMALGARASDVLRFVMRQGMAVVCIGALLGIAGAWMLSRYEESLLFGVTKRDPIAFAAAPLGLIAIALLACYLPARRATRIDPNTALREQ
jgi:putative ABC transport system permease protein